MVTMNYIPHAAGLAMLALSSTQTLSQAPIQYTTPQGNTVQIIDPKCSLTDVVSEFIILKEGNRYPVINQYMKGKVVSRYVEPNPREDMNPNVALGVELGDRIIEVHSGNRDNDNMDYILRVNIGDAVTVRRSYEKNDQLKGFETCAEVKRDIKFRGARLQIIRANNRDLPSVQPLK